MNKRNYNAFTLAEVLITLAIIAIVTVLVIPPLVKNYTEKTWSTANTIFLENFEEATKQMNTHGELIGHKSTLNFLNQLKKYLKINDICEVGQNNKCFSDEINVNGNAGTITYNVNELKSAINFKKKFGTEIRSLVLTNGTTMLLAYDPECKYIDPYDNQVDTTKCIAMYYDVNGKKKPNTIGQDIYSLNNPSLFRNTCYKLESGLCVGVEDIDPVAINNLDSQYNESIEQAGLSPCTEAACAKADYYLGATLACQELGMRLPTETEFYEIAALVYNNDCCIGKSYELGTCCSVGLRGELNNVINMTISSSDGYIMEYRYPGTSIKGIHFENNKTQGFSGCRGCKKWKVRCVK